jgi:hypothetical protein
VGSKNIVEETRDIVASKNIVEETRDAVFGTRSEIELLYQIDQAIPIL